MSRRTVSSAKRQSRLRRSSSGPGELEEDSNVFEKEDPFWYKRMERNNTVLRPSLQLNIFNESSVLLGSESDVDMPPPQDGWWKPLGKFNQTINQTSKVRRTIPSSVNAEPTAEDITLHEDSLDSLPEKNPRKRKKRLFLGSKKKESVGGSAFLKVLNESVTTIISDPGPSKRRKSIPKISFLSDEDSFKQNQNPITRKSRPALFTKIRNTQSESTTNVFNNLLGNVSSSSDSSIPAVNNNQQAQTFNESQKSEAQNTIEIEPSQVTVSQKCRSTDAEQNLSLNLSKKQRTIRSSSKTADTSISPNSKAKTSFTEERKENSTFESNFGDVELQKKRPVLIKLTRKSMATNAFDNILSSEEEPIQEVAKVNKRQYRSSSTKSLEKDHEYKKNKTNFSQSQSSKMTRFEESNKLKEREDLSDSSSEIGVENKNDESTKSRKAENRESHQPSQIDSQNNPEKVFHKIPVTSVSCSKQTSEILDNEEEDLISVGSQVVAQSNRSKSLRISKKHNSSLNQSKGTSQNVDNSRRSSHLNESIKVPDRQSNFAEQLQYESTRKMDVPKYIKSQRSGELITEELRTGDPTFLNKSKDTSQNLNNSRRSSRLNKSIEVPDRLSTFAEQPQYESTRKIDVPIFRKSQRSGELLTEELRTGNPTSLNHLRNVSSRKTSDDEKASIEVSDAQHLISTEENRKQSRHSTSKREFANTENQSREKERSVDSQRSRTISLSEGGSIQLGVPSENNLPLNATSQSNDQHMKTSSNKRYATSFIPSDISSDDENLEENNLSKKKTAKPIITDYEILKANDIDVRKLKCVKEIWKEHNTSVISRLQSAIRDISASKSVEKSSIFPKNSQMLVVEDEFRRLHGQEISEIASISREHSQISRNLFTKDFDNNRARETSNNKSSSDLRKILEDHDNESEVSETPLLIYSENFGEDVQESEYEETSPAKDLQRKIPGEDFRDQKQKIIDDYFKRRNTEKTEGKSQSQRIPFAKAAGNKNLMADHKKQLEAIVAPIKKELFKRPKGPEPPKKKVFIAKETSKKKQSKIVDPAYLVNGVPYKLPKLPRPKHWATDHLYKFIWKKIEPAYKGKKRVRSEKFVLRLTEVFNKVTRVKLYEDYVEDLENLIQEMARLRLIVNHKDFNDFCNEFMPYQFRVKTTPILLPGNIMSIPYDKEKFYAPILSDGSSLGG